MVLRRDRGLALIALSTLVFGCDDPAGSLLSFAVPTEIAVNPTDFLGDTSCSPNEGAMRSYVMTLSAFEDERDVSAFLVGSTQATSCSLVAGFREVIVPGQRHIAAVDGYDLPAAALEPFGGTSSGSRQMRHVETGEVVLPRWTTHCGAGANGGAIALQTRRVFVRPCEPIVDTAPTPTLLAIGPSQVLGDDACALAPSFDVGSETTGLPPTSDLSCDAEAVTYEVEAGTRYELYATTTMAEVLYGSLCSATAVRGVTVVVACNPLTATGRASVTLSDVQNGAAEPLCPAGSVFDVVAGQDVLNPIPLPCEGVAQVGPLVGGLKLLDVVIYDASGTETGRGNCGVSVEPGKTTVALCAAVD